MTPDVTLVLAVTAGTVSFLSPCVLPLIPAYVAFITGASLDELTGRDRMPARSVLRHALLFVSGFSVVFIAMGGSAGFLGGVLIAYSRIFEIAGGALLVLFGLLLSGIVRTAWANREWRVHLSKRPAGRIGTVAAGMAFGFGWTPCIGPILGGILTLAATGEEPVRGMVLLSGYSFGLAIPFLLAAVGLSRFLTLRGRIGPWLPWVQRASGVVLIVLGVLLITGDFSQIAAALSRMTPSFLLERM